MADFFLSNLKSTLDNCITELDEIHSMFCRNPESDFTRNRKLSFREYIQFMLQMQSKSVSNAVNICNPIHEIPISLWTEVDRIFSIVLDRCQILLYEKHGLCFVTIVFEICPAYVYCI